MNLEALGVVAAILIASIGGMIWLARNMGILQERVDTLRRNHDELAEYCHRSRHEWTEEIQKYRVEALQAELERAKSFLNPKT